MLDVDNTLFDGDRVMVDFHNCLKQQLGSTCARRYWVIFDRLRQALGYPANEYRERRRTCRACTDH